MLAAIVDRCLAADPSKRYANVQAVLDALDARASRLARRPMMVLGAIGPALVLAVVTWFAWQGFSAAVWQSNEALTARALQTNSFAAQYVARLAANELERRYRAVDQVAASEPFRRRLAETLAKPELRRLLVRLSDPKLKEAELETLRKRFLDSPDRRALEKEFEGLVASATPSFGKEAVAAWLFCDANGISTVRVPEGRTIGKNFAWRSYFYGGPRDMDETWRPGRGQHIAATTLSDVFRSKATSRWTVAISAPVYDDAPEKKFLGVVAMTVEVGRFVQFPSGDNQFAVLVDNREGEHKGVILQHPLFDKMMTASTDGRLPERFENYRVGADDLPNTTEREEHYRDPLAADAEGSEYGRVWLARMEPVRVRGRDSGWVVIVQEAYDTAIEATLQKLEGSLVGWGLIALGLIVSVMAGMWAMARKMTKE